jgi:acyl carrier protein phosphodiesterase
MNYLAHAYLSFENEWVLVGNMISDFLKGKSRWNFSEDIQKGITLHRMIDNFTDVHPATKHAKEILKPAANRYASVFVDIVYDHFLATDNTEFPFNKLEHFANETYRVLQKHSEMLPPKFKNILPYMVNQNWLLNYRFTEGLENSFNSVFRRAKYLSKTNEVFKCFTENYYELRDCYNLFFPELKNFAFNEYNILVQQ